MSATQDKDQTYIYHSSHLKLVVLIVMIATTVASNYKAQVQWKKRRRALFVSGGTSTKVLKFTEPGHMCQHYHHCDQGKGSSAWVQPGAPLASHGLRVGAVWAQNEIKVLCEEQISYLLMYS